MLITTVTIRIQKTEPQSFQNQSWSQIESQSKRARASVALQEQDRSFEKLTDKFDYFFKEHDLYFTKN
jgi:hypothetical protein